MDKPIGDKLLVFFDKTLHVCISSQKPRGCVKSLQLAPRVSPSPGTDNARWVQLELTDA